MNNNIYNELDELDYNEYIYNKSEPIYIIDYKTSRKTNKSLETKNKQQDKQQKDTKQSYNNESDKEVKINKPKAYKLSDYL